MSETRALAASLIQLPSVTPHDAGCMELLAERLRPLGFVCEREVFGEVANLWARIGAGRPLLAFVGHTDVVPTGPEAQWHSPPFEPTEREGRLYGRGAADMKSSVAAFVTACERYLARPRTVPGSIALLLTSDEEGPAIDGVRRMAQWLQDRDEVPDMCLVGEPSSSERFGDTVKIGRRGSLNARLIVRGIQGHVAYPHKALNPIHALAPALDALAKTIWDEGNAHFPATTFQVSNIQAGTGATNVIPDHAECLFNFRFSTEVTAEQLMERTEQLLTAHGLAYTVEWTRSAEPFLTEQGALVEGLTRAIQRVTGKPPALTTTGGTSDGRFLAPLGCQVAEFGPINASIHQIDENIGVAELDQLSDVYEALLGELFGR